MTDNEIIKALLHWIENFEGSATDFLILSNAYALIERLKDYNENLQTANMSLSNEILESKSEARKEFVERLKQEKIYSLERHEYIIPVSVMDWTLQKMESESNG